MSSDTFELKKVGHPEWKEKNRYSETYSTENEKARAHGATFANHLRSSLENRTGNKFNNNDGPCSARGLWRTSSFRKLQVPCTNYVNRPTLIVVVIKICTFVGVLPYKWNEDESRLESTTSKWQIFLWAINYLIYLLYFIFLIWRNIQMEYFRGKLVGTKNEMQYFALSAFAPLWFHVELIRNWNMLPSYFNRVHKFYQVFHETLTTFYMDDENVKSKKLWSGYRRRIRCIKMIVPAIIVLYIFRLTARQTRPNHLTSLVAESDSSLNKWELIPFIAINGHIWCFQFCTYLLNCIALCEAYVLKEFLCIVKNDRHRVLRKQKLFIRFYSQMRVLHLEFNDNFGTNCSVCVILLCITVIMNVYLAVVFYSSRAVFLGIAACYCIFVVILEAGDVYDMSDQVLKSWTSYGSSLWFWKFKRASRPLYTPILNLGFVEKSTLLTITSTVINYSVNMIISHNEFSTLNAGEA